MTRRALVAALAVAAVAPATAPAQSGGVNWNCRASSFYVTLTDNNRIEPVLANGNAATANGASPDNALCADSSSGFENLATPLAIPTDVASARTASAITDIEPPAAQTATQTVRSTARVERLELPLGSGTVVLGVAVANSEVTGSCAGGVAQLNGTTQLTGITIGGQEISLDAGLEQLAAALAPLGPLVDIKVNEHVRDATSLTVRPLHIKVLSAAGDVPLLDVVVAESRVVAPAGVCDPNNGVIGGGNPSIRPCPRGAELDAPSGFCVIRPGPGHPTTIVVGRPFEGPSGGTVIPTSIALQRYPNSPCVKGSGPLFTIVGTSGRDRITGTNGRDRILGLSGNDNISGGRGDDCLEGNRGSDSLSGSLGNDRVYGTAGNDHLNGGPGTDRLSAGSGNDSINGAYGADNVFGGPGRDFINVATAGRRAKVSCGSGRDKVRFNHDERRTIRRDCEVRYLFRDRPRS